MKKLFKILLTVLISFVFLMETRAYEYEDVEMSVVDIDLTRATPLLAARVEITGVTPGDEDFILMSNSSSPLEDQLDSEYDEDILYYSFIQNGYGSIDTFGKVAMRGQTVYAAIYRFDNSSRKNIKMSNTVQIERPEFPVNRTFNVFFLEYISIFTEDFDDLNASKTIHYKIGHVTNNSILRSVKGGNYTSLYNFAKGDTSPVATNEITCTITCQIPNSLNKNNFTAGDFYYVYTYRDTANGKYVELEDISLYQYSDRYDYVFLNDVEEDGYIWDIDDDEGGLEPSTRASIEFASNSYTCEEGTTIETYIISTSPFTLYSSDESIATIAKTESIATKITESSPNPTSQIYNANDNHCPANNDNCYDVEITCVGAGSVRLTATNEEDVTATQEVVVVEELVPVTITYNLEDGAVCKDETKTVDSGNKWGVLCTPTRSGYTFEGWYTEKTGGSKVTKNTLATGDITVYARWSKIKNPKTGVTAPISGLLIMTAASVLTFIILTKKSKQFNS